MTSSMEMFCAGRVLRAIRRFSGFAVVVAATFVLFSPLPAPAADHASTPKVSLAIADVQLGSPTYYDYGGDSWDPAWAQDDELYTAVNDGAGLGTMKRNIGFNQVTGMILWP
jgi:hypothetical protein